MGTRNPLEVFPLEIWKIIFETLEGEPGCSKNLLNFSRVCTTFQNVLKPTKSEWLFESIFPHIFPYLKKKRILRCRRVCKEWCRVVDTYLEDFEPRRPFNDETSNVSRLMLPRKLDSSFRDPLKIKWTHLRFTEKISKYMKVMKPQGRNPFVGGSLILGEGGPVEVYEETYEVDSEEDEHDFVFDEQLGDIRLSWNKACELVAMFGDHIKFIEFKPFFKSMDVRELYKVLRQCLPFLSNLKSLTISGGYEVYCFDDDDNEVYLGPLDKLRLVQNVLDEDSSSLVEIPSLESLVIETHDLPLNVCEKLMAHINPRNLKTLKLDLYLDIFDQDTWIKVHEPLSSLTELHLNPISSLDYLNHWFNNIIQGAPLGKLVLEFDLNSDELNFDLVCDAINRFGTTLKMLAISADHGCMIYQNYNYKFPIPSLSKLETPHLRRLEVHGLIFRGRFLPQSCAQSLEYLLISFPLGRFQLKSPSMMFYKRASEGKLCYSQVWNEMPNLKLVHVYMRDEKFSCTRKMYLDSKFWKRVKS